MYAHLTEHLNDKCLNNCIKDIEFTRSILLSNWESSAKSCICQHFLPLPLHKWSSKQKVIYFSAWFMDIMVILHYAIRLQTLLK